MIALDKLLLHAAVVLLVIMSAATATAREPRAIGFLISDERFHVVSQGAVFELIRKDDGLYVSQADPGNHIFGAPVRLDAPGMGAYFVAASLGQSSLTLLTTDKRGAASGWEIDLRTLTATERWTVLTGDGATDLHELPHHEWLVPTDGDASVIRSDGPCRVRNLTLAPLWSANRDLRVVFVNAAELEVFQLAPKSCQAVDNLRKVYAGMRFDGLAMADSGWFCLATRASGEQYLLQFDESASVRKQLRLPAARDRWTIYAMSDGILAVAQSGVLSYSSHDGAIHRIAARRGADSVPVLGCSVRKPLFANRDGVVAGIEAESLTLDRVYELPLGSRVHLFSGAQVFRTGSVLAILFLVASILAGLLFKRRR